MSLLTQSGHWPRLALAARSQSARLFLGGHLQRREFIASRRRGSRVAAHCARAASPEGRIPLSRSRDGVVRRIAAFIEGLRSAGFRVPEQIDVVARVADGDPARLAPLAAELIEQKPDVIVTVGSAAARIVHSATTTIPIVAHDLDTDPVASGLIKSLGHPGGNVTGYFFGFPQFRMKWVEVLKETIPNLTNVSVMGPRQGPRRWKAVEEAAGVIIFK